MYNVWTQGWYDGYYRRERKSTDDAYSEGFIRGACDRDLEVARKLDSCQQCGIPMCEHTLAHQVGCLQDWAWAGASIT